MKKMITIIATLVIVLSTGCAKSSSTWNNRIPSIDSNAISSKTNRFMTNVVDNLIKETLTQPVKDWKKADKIINLILQKYRNRNALPYNDWSVYYLEGEKKVFTFDPPNDFYEVVMMDEENDNEAFVIHYSGQTGIAFGQWGYYCYKDYPFYGLTKNFVLFKKGNDIIATPFTPEIEPDGNIHWNVLNFDKLPPEEQKTAVYPNGYTIRTF